MIGKIIASIVIIGAILLGLIWIFTGQSPVDLVKDIVAPGNHISSNDVVRLEYQYTLNLREPYKSNNVFKVVFNVVRRTADKMCYTYTIADVKSGNPDLVHGFMKGFYGVEENTTICSPKDVESEGFIPIYPLVDPGTSISGRKAGSDYSYTYHYEHGILESFNMNTTYTIQNNTVPAQLTIKLTKTVLHEKSGSTTTSQSGTAGKESLSSQNVSWITYRFQWEIPIQDVVTGQVTQTKTLDYTVKVEVVSRQGSQACVKYSIINVTTGSIDNATQYTSQILGYNPGAVRCVDLSASPTPEGIPYFLFNPSFTATDIKINGSGVNGLFSVKNGIFYSLIVYLENQILDENGNVVSSATTTLRVNILDMG